LTVWAPSTTVGVFRWDRYKPSLDTINRTPARMHRLCLAPCGSLEHGAQAAPSSSRGKSRAGKASASGTGASLRLFRHFDKDHGGGQVVSHPDPQSRQAGTATRGGRGRVSWRGAGKAANIVKRGQRRRIDGGVMAASFGCVLMNLRCTPALTIALTPLYMICRLDWAVALGICSISVAT